MMHISVKLACLNDGEEAVLKNEGAYLLFCTSEDDKIAKLAVEYILYGNAL
jgi:hypothetical protein